MDNQFARRNLTRLLGSTAAPSSSQTDKQIRCLASDGAAVIHEVQESLEPGKDNLPGSASPLNLPDDELSDFP
jgi:hypothetical protein